MDTRFFILGLALVPMLTGTVARADQTKHLRCISSSSAVVGVETNIDTNGDGLSAGVTQTILNCGGLRFFVQNENEFLAPAPPAHCPSGTSFEQTLVQSHAVRIEEKTGDQLFTEFTSGTVCVKLPDLTFTATTTAVFAGGTGRFSGATGTLEGHLAGSYLVTGHKGSNFGGLNQSTGTSTETLVLPKGGED